jgi:hypothetical protein
MPQHNPKIEIVVHYTEIKSKEAKIATCLATMSEWLCHYLQYHKILVGTQNPYRQ